MSGISQFFFRESFFTKNHDEKNPNTNAINLFTKNTIHNKNNNNIERESSIKSSENSDSIDMDLYDEMELFHAKVETIIPIDNKINNNNAIYNIKIRNSQNFDESWTKSCTLDELINFREYLLKYDYTVINQPFPEKSWLRFLPYIGHKYDERNWDILLENKFLLDDFFNTICKDKEMYKLTGFVSFFSKPVIKGNKTNLFSN